MVDKMLPCHVKFNLHNQNPALRWLHWAVGFPTKPQKLLHPMQALNRKGFGLTVASRLWASSRGHNVWATQRKNEQKLNEARFPRSRGRKT